ncbi:hypothetical protein Tco_0375144 [Tanacetum coccineum]
MEYEKDPLRLYRICSPEYPQKGTFALPNQTVVATTIEVGTDVGSPNVRTSRGYYYILNGKTIKIEQQRHHVSKDQHQAYVGSLANVDHLTFVAQGKLASGCVCEVTALVAYQSMFIGSDFLL